MGVPGDRLFGGVFLDRFGGAGEQFEPAGVAGGVVEDELEVGRGVEVEGRGEGEVAQVDGCPGGQVVVGLEENY